MEKGSIGSTVTPPVTMTTFNEQQVQQALAGGDLTQGDQELLQEWLSGDQQIRDELDGDVKDVLDTITPPSTPSTSGLDSFSEEELEVLLPRLNEDQQAGYMQWQSTKSSVIRKRLETQLLPALKIARDSVRLEQRKKTLSDAFYSGTLGYERISEGEITILLSVLGHEESQTLLARATLAQARLAAFYQGLATFSRSRGNKTCFGLARYRTDAEILSALQRGVMDPLSLPPTRPLQRFIWKLRGWDV